MHQTRPGYEKRIVIYGLGDFGLETYFRLKERGIKIDYFADRDLQKKGYALDGLYCRTFDELLQEDRRRCILIVAVQKNKTLIDEFRRHGFQNVYDKETAVRLLAVKEDLPEISPLQDLHLIEELKRDIQDGIYYNKKEVHEALQNIVDDYFLRNKDRKKNNTDRKTVQAKILEVNVSDLSGHVFNGYDLHIALIKRGISAGQLVLDKRSTSGSVISIPKDLILHYQIREFEKIHSINNFLYPCGEAIFSSPEFQAADLVHYHILYNGAASLLDYPRLMNAKKSVWTIHDPWILTGNCLYPLMCGGWKTGCGNCKKTNEILFKLNQDTTNFMWEQKKRILSQMNPHIVVSCGFMENYLKQSPLTQHFSNVHIIPFGIDPDKYSLKGEGHSDIRKDREKTVIAFRSDRLERKGCKYIYEALQKLNAGNKIELLCVGNENVPSYIKDKYHTTELGWVDDESEIIRFFQSCDIFLMPSLAETFGVMAIEAMAAGCTVISFKDTVLEEVTNAPECGIAVEYSSSDAIAEAIMHLLGHPEELSDRGRKGCEFVKENYSFDQYVDRHIRLYQEIMEES